MSALFGIFFTDHRPVERLELKRMSEKLAHRGHDAQGIWSDRQIGLGHRMLWSTPESLQERLPLCSSDSAFVITADARIDNRDELIKLLGLTNSSAATVADSHIILASYQKWGEGCASSTESAFAM
ncbi:MAG: hypothetical protein H7Y02_09140 [Candidatus Obscuribacterales bacterium]|nr:hypothetical protein [Steroidobacteraceae bacterium]